MSKPIHFRAAPEMAQRDLTVRELSLRAETADDDARTVRATVATSAPTQVLDLRTYERIDETLVIGGVQIPSKTPLLEQHDRWNTDSVIGSVRSFDVRGERIEAILYFAKGDERAERVWPKVRDGHLDSVSIGYQVDEYTDIPAGESRTIAGKKYTAGERTLRVTTGWQIREVSVVVIPADAGAKIREQNEALGAVPGGDKHDKDYESIMERENKDTATPKGAIELEREREATRVSAIYDLAKDDIDPALVKRAITEHWTPEKASEEFLRSWREAGSKPIEQPHSFGIRIGGDDATARMISDALRLRGGAFPAHDPHASNERKLALEQRHEAASRYVDLSLVDIARHAVQLDGNTVPVNRGELIERAFSGGSLSNIFSTNINAMLQDSYELYPDSTRGLCRERDVNNFLAIPSIRGVHTSDGLARHSEGAEADHIGLSDTSEEYKCYRYTGQFTVDEQAIIDDRVDLLLDTPRVLGGKASMVRPNLVLYILQANGNLTDGSPIYSAASDALAADALQTGIAAMQNTREGGMPLNIRPRFLLVPPDLEATALTLIVSGERRGDATSDGTANPLMNQLEVRSDSRLSTDGVTDPITGTTQAGSATNWILLASPDQAPVVEVAYVSGTGRAPQVRSSVLTQGKWGLNFDVKLDIGACACGRLGIYASTGAG